MYVGEMLAVGHKRKETDDYAVMRDGCTVELYPVCTMRITIQ